MFFLSPVVEATPSDRTPLMSTRPGPAGADDLLVPHEFGFLSAVLRSLSDAAWQTDIHVSKLELASQGVESIGIHDHWHLWVCESSAGRLRPGHSYASDDR